MLDDRDLMSIVETTTNLSQKVVCLIYASSNSKNVNIKLRLGNPRIYIVRREMILRIYNS